MVFVTLNAAAAALKGWWWLENVPQGASADLAAGWEVVQSENKLVALVADVWGSFTEWRSLHYNLLITFNLAFVGIQDLGEGKKRRILFDFFEYLNPMYHLGCRSWEVREGTDEKVQKFLHITWNILGISLASARYTSVWVTGRTWNNLLWEENREGGQSNTLVTETFKVFQLNLRSKTSKIRISNGQHHKIFLVKSVFSFTIIKFDFPNLSSHWF